MPNIKALSLKVKSYKQTKSVTDGRTDGQTTDKVIPKWRSASLSPEKYKCVLALNLKALNKF